jgi:THO complex subunit 3
MLDWRPSYQGGGCSHPHLPPPPPPPPPPPLVPRPGIGLDEQLLGHAAVHSKNVNSIGWNLTGTKLASGSDDRTARIYDVGDAGQVKPLLKLDGHADSVVQLCWDPTSPHRVVTVASEKDKTVRIWDIRTGKPTMVQKMGNEYLNVAWSPDGNYIGVSSSTTASSVNLAVKDFMSIIDVRKGKAKLHKFPYQVEEFCFSPNSKFVVLTTENGTVEVFRFENEEGAEAAVAAAGGAAAAAAAGGGGGGGGGEIPVEQGGRGVVRSIQAHSGNCYSVAMDPAKRHMAVGSKDSLVSLWSLDELVCVRTIGQHATAIRSLSFSPDGARIASASYDQVIDVSVQRRNIINFGLCCVVCAACASFSLHCSPSGQIHKHSIHAQKK